MKAALLLGPGKIAIGDLAEPEVAPGEVMIRPQIAGVCGTDISIFAGHRPVSYPFILGHELVGRVTALGSGVTKLRVGERVVVEPNYPCGTCALCRAGRGAVCGHKRSMGVSEAGCFAECATAPAEFVWPLPDTISIEDAATIEPLVVSVHGLLQSGVKEGHTIAVLGCGVVGLLLIHAAAAAGVRVIAHDRLEEKRVMAERLGAIAASTEDVAALWDRENVTTVFECAGVTQTVELALRAAPRGSDIILLGISSSPASFIPMRLVREGINLRTSMIYDHPGDFAYVIDQVAKGLLHPSRVVTHTYGFGEIGEALALAAKGGAGKIHIEMS